MTAVADRSCPLINGGTGIPARVRDIPNAIALQSPNGEKIGFSGTQRASAASILLGDGREAELFCTKANHPRSIFISTYVDMFRTQVAGS